MLFIGDDMHAKDVPVDDRLSTLRVPRRTGFGMDDCVEYEKREVWFERDHTLPPGHSTNVSFRTYFICRELSEAASMKLIMSTCYGPGY